MRQFDVLSRHLEVKDHFFLEASAGTGKTFAIEHLVCRLILEGFNLEDILIVTFTKAATRDLRQRVIKNIYKIIDQIEKKKAIFDYVNALIEQEEEVRFNALISLKKALQAQHSAQIFTIHGFCYRMLKEFAFDANVHFNLMDPDEGSPKSVYIEHIMHTLRTSLDEDIVAAAQLEIIMRFYKKDLTKLVSGLLPMLDGYKNIGETTSFITYLKECNLEFLRIKECFSLQKAQKLAFFYKESTSRDKQLKEEFKQQLDYISSLMELGEITKEQMSRLMTFDPDIFSLFSIENRKKNLKPPLPILNQMEEMEQCLIRWNKLIYEMRDPLRIQLTLGVICRASLERKLLEKDIILTDRLLDQMLISIQQENFCRLLRKKYQAVIIDEFQDTDPKQWQIFSHLFLSDSSLPVCCFVGDPKQSIYAFRNADLQTYFIAKNNFPKEKQFALGVNFRSTATLVDGLNLLFEHAPKWLEYYPVNSFFKKEEKEKKPICFFGGSFSKTKKGHFPPREIEEEYYFSYMANEIIRLQREGVPFDEQVILVKDRFQARRIEKFLRDVNIPVVSNAKVSLSESPVFTLMERVFLLLMNPQDINLLKQLLSIGIIAIDRDILENNLSDYRLQEAVAYFELVKKQFYEEGIGVVCKTILEQSIITGAPSLEDSLISFDNLDLYHDMMQLIQLLMESSSSFYYGLFDVVEFFSKLRRTGVEEDKTFFRKPSKEGSCVTIMTTFTSKGLEFSVVFAYGLMTRNHHKSSFFYSSQQERCFFLNEHELEITQLLIANDQEKLRQLYVALTRAKTVLYIPFCFQEEMEGLKIGEASALELFYCFILLGVQTVEEAYVHMPRINQMLLKQFLEKQSEYFSFTVLERDKEINVLSQQREVPVLVAPNRVFLSKKETKTFSFSVLVAANQREVEHKEMEHDMPYGPEVGNLIHIIFEKIIQNGWNLEKFEHQRKKIIYTALKGTILNDWTERVGELIEQALLLEFPQGFCLSQVDPSFMLQEVEFLYSVSKQNKMKGFIDLLFQYQGKYFIVDWKTNSLPSYSTEEMNKEMHRHAYFSQGAIYTQALKKYIGIMGDEFTKVFGGVHYMFLKGSGLYSFYPSEHQMDEVFAWMK
ncbi:MAG: UvrD-helicase domain-containing protein [Chlamydiales bacterium]|nr:UvrD-helicase domain-containing protein [Chlamydiales bacterium]